MKNMMSAGNMSCLRPGVTKIEYVGLNQGSANYGPQTKNGQQPIVTSKFY